jgi:hypothetical protein
MGQQGHEAWVGSSGKGQKRGTAIPQVDPPNILHASIQLGNPLSFIHLFIQQIFIKL